jgi:cyanobactin maturation PatA/PatG family protease
MSVIPVQSKLSPPGLIHGGSDNGVLGRLGHGDPRICIAVLDGPVDTSHPCFKNAALAELQTGVPAEARTGWPLAHGTHVASILFGQPGSPMHGLVPRCRGLIVPIFARGNGDASLGCSQLDLARALLLAIENGANIINISGGQLSPSGEPDPILTRAIETCARRNVLIVAAAGNDGCDCLHIPAAVSSVLAIGAMDRDGNPLASSNWGEAYRDHGLLAPGADVLGAAAGTHGTTRKSGTSFAAPTVSAIAALLASLQLKQGQAHDLGKVREILLKSAVPCLPATAGDCRRFLSGSLNIEGAVELIEQGDNVMIEHAVITPSVSAVPRNPESAPELVLAAAEHARSAVQVSRGVMPSEADLAPAVALQTPSASPTGDHLTLSDCGCGGGAAASAPAKPAIVYVLGKIGYDFGTEARRDSFIQAMGGGNPADPRDLLAYLQANPHDAGSIIWTLNLDATPVYAIQPAGAFAAYGYDRLREFLDGQVNQGVELVSVPGAIGGSVRLQSGQVVPVVVPALRGMFSWASAPLAAHVLGLRPESADTADAAVASYDTQVTRLGEFLDRVYYDLRNLGVTAEERALNYSATNALQAAEVIRATTQQRLDLDKVHVRKSPVCRPDSDCYDVELSFFNPDNTRTATRVFRFTIDVSDVIPVTIGSIRSWTRKE